MKLRKAEGANKTGVSRMRGIIASPRPTFRVALLLLSTGVVYTAVTVAAAREPDSQAAYGPPSPPAATEAAPTAQREVAAASEAVYADPVLPVGVPAVGYAAVAAVVEAPEAGIAGDPAETADESGVEEAPEPAATSSVVESPVSIASSWTMSPLPEEEGGVVTSSTQQTPVSSTSAIVASPQ
jgi:hypothetical protein